MKNIRVIKSIFYSVVLVAGLVLTGLSGNLVYGQTQQKSAIQKTVKYTCPMHPEVVKDMPGKCPKCERPLVKTEEKQKDAKMYTCVKHPDVVTDKPGKCPKCTLPLVEKMDKDRVRMRNMKDSILMKNRQMR